MRHRLLSAPLAALCAVAGCARETPIALRVLAADGSDPFTMPDGATHARITIEDDATAPQVVPVGPGGAFSVEVRPARPEALARLRIEALRGSEVVGTGATPPVVWQGRGGQLVAVLMHPRDTIIPAPVSSFRAPRADLRLVPLGLQGVAAVTTPPGETVARAPDGYDLLAHASASLPQQVPAEFDGDTAVVPVRGAWLLQRGARAVLYTGSDAQPPQAFTGVPAERQALLGATVVADEVTGGGWLLGGRSAPDAPSTRVDRVTNDQRFVQPPPAALSVARYRPDTLVLRVATSATAPTWLIVGGQREGEAAFEVYSPGTGGTPLLLGDDPLARRFGTTAVCIATDAEGCTRVLVLGGRTPDGQVAPDDALLDGACARTGGTGCTLVLARGAWLSRRRWSARAALAENGRVLVAGGHDAGGAVREVETVDVSNPGAPRPGRVLQTLPYDDPAVASVANGSVLVAGGRNPDGSARGDLWFYRY
jgi:hypothetical protein